ncbi:MAG TPA: hypothetical protein VFJ58_15445, partial [Armatimonadota bacterium]|nr:hypothetical protein [Armatimonadota bacterium]
GYTTGTYNLVQFDHPPTVSIQQPDANLPTADRLFNIQFKALATDTPATVDLYYATDNSGANGQIIVRGLEASGAQTFGWDTSSIPPGDYYIYAVCSDGVLTPVTAVSTGAARVIHAAPTVTSTSPGTLALGASGVNVVVTGTALGTSTSSVSFLRSGNPDPAITVSDVQVSQDQTSLTASVTVAGTAIPGPRTVVVSTVVGASAAASSPGSTILVGLPDSYTIPAGLQLLSSPFQYNETSFTVLFGLPKVDAAVWAPGANQYAFSPNSPADTFHPGAAVWIQLKAPVTVHPQGFAAPDGQPFKIDLQTGWNMIGDPFPAPIPLAGVSLVDAGGQTTPYAAAVTAGDASPLYAFDTSQKQYAATGASGSIQPWAGYWLMVDAPGTLVVPPP